MQLESRSDIAGESQLKFQPFKDQVKNLEEQIQCLKVDNEQLRLLVNDFITTSVDHNGHVAKDAPVKTSGLLISEELKIENDTIDEQTILISTDSQITYQIPSEKAALHHEVSVKCDKQ